MARMSWLPGAVLLALLGGLAAAPAAADDSCRYAHDGECDEPKLGGGYCAAGTDTSDCAALAAGSNDSCRWANDGVCDEPGLGGGECDSGTDRTDCLPVAYMRYRDNSCQYSFDGECDEPGGTGLCEARTDTVDCLGRDRPPGLRDYYGGHDDRVRLDSTAYPWRSIGQVTFESGGTCTATLIAPRAVLTAAHCLFDVGSNRIDPPVAFIAGRSDRQRQGRANVVDWYYAPGYSNTADDSTQPGRDWGVLVLDQPIGDQVGYLSLRRLTPADEAAIAAGSWLPLAQGGYAWDADLYLTGQIGCRLVRLLPNGDMIHDCDTTVGDSGSPILVDEGGVYSILGVDSRYGEDAGAAANVAVDTRAFAAAVDKYLAGLN